MPLPYIVWSEAWRRVDVKQSHSSQWYDTPSSPWVSSEPTRNDKDLSKAFVYESIEFDTQRKLVGGCPKRMAVNIVLLRYVLFATQSLRADTQCSRPRSLIRWLYSETCL